MGQKIAALREGLDEGDPSVTVQRHCCSCHDDPRPEAGPSTVKAVYSASRDWQDAKASNLPLDVGHGREDATKINYVSLNAVVHTEDEIRVEQDTPEERAERKAEAIFKYLRVDWSDEAMRELTQEVGKLALSKERVKVVLQHTQDKRLSCVHLNDLIKLVALEAHKEQVLFERYPHLTDKENFETEIVNTFTLSTSIRGSLLRKLTKFLISRPQVDDGSFSLGNAQESSV
jgi:hypothetical protein